MKRIKRWIAQGLALALLLSACLPANAMGDGEAGDPTAPEATATAVPEATATAAPEATATAAPEATATAAPEATATAAPEATATVAPEATATVAPEATVTAAPEATATVAPETTATAVPEPTATVAPEATATAAPETTATAAPETTATTAPETTATAAPAEEPTATPLLVIATPTPSPTPYRPVNEAWAILADGTQMNDTLTGLLYDLIRLGASATMYVATSKEALVENVPEHFFERVTILPDPYVYGKGYEAVAEDMGDGSYIVRVQSIAKPTPTPTPKPKPTETAQATQTPEIVVIPAMQAKNGMLAVCPSPIITVQEANELQGIAPDEAQGQPDASDASDPNAQEIKNSPSEEDEQFKQEQDEEEEEGLLPTYSLRVLMEGIGEGEWRREPAVFVLSSDVPEGTEYAYGVVFDDGRVVPLSGGRTTYTPPEGENTFGFVILDEEGDWISVESPTYTVRWDITPPDGPYVEGPSQTEAVIHAEDKVSGVTEISLDGGETWRPFDEEKGYTLYGTENSMLVAGSIVVRDAAGNASALAEEYYFTWGEEEKPRLGGGGGTKVVRHVKETADYSLANYNGLDLEFSDEPGAVLVAGGKALPVSLTSTVNDVEETGLFTAYMTDWKIDKEDERKTPNTLVLSASGSGEMNTWTFSGDAYRMLYNSGVDYLVFDSGGYMTAVSTAGFTAGTTYAKLKAGGTSTRKFSYTISQDEALRETTITVEVGGETYLLGEEHDQPMYRYDVLIGSMEMLDKPFKSFLPEYGEDGQTDTAAEDGEQEFAGIPPKAQEQTDVSPGGVLTFT